MPTGSAARRYRPSESLASVRVKPVDGLFAVTVAPGTAAPCWSTTRPVTLPVVCCANVVAQASNTSAAAPKNFLIIPTPPDMLCGLRQRLLADSDLWRPPSAIETPELTVFCPALEPLILPQLYRCTCSRTHMKRCEKMNLSLNVIRTSGSGD